MADDKMNLEIGVDVHVTDLDQAKALREEFERLNAEILKLARDIKAAANPMASLGRARAQLSASAARGGNAALDAERQTYADLKRRFAFERRMQAQQRKEESTAAKRLKDEQAEARRALNDQLAFSNKIARQRAQSEAEAERETRRQISETAKMRDRENRKALSDAKALERAQDRAASRAAHGVGQVRSGVGRIAGTAAAAGAVVGYGAERFVGRGIASRMDTDTAETALQIFGDMPDGKGGKRTITAQDIRNLRRGPAGLDMEAIRSGVSIKEALTSYTEVAKAGLIDPMAQTRNLLAATTALELDPGATTKLMGTMSRNMGAAATPARLKQTLNALAVGAREDPTQAGEIVEGLNRAQGILAMTKGLTEEDLVALVSGGQSVGIQPGKAGTFLPALGRSILEGGNKFIDRKKRKELNFAARNLGFGSAKNMAQMFSGQDGKSVIYQIFGKMQAMAPQLRQQVADALSGGQWADEDLQIVNGLDGMKSTDREIHDPRNANFLDEARAKKMRSWRGMWEQSKTIFSLFWESFGAGFDGILREINTFVLDLHGKLDYDRISGYVREGLDGLKAGLGFDTWKQALESLIPSNVGNLGKQIGGFAKGFAAAIRDIAGAVAAVAGMFGGNGSAESIGRLTAQFLSLGAAAVVLAPVLGVLGGVTSIVLGLANVARAAAAVLGLGAGAAAGGIGSSAVTGALAGVARLLSGGFVLGLSGAIGARRGEISTLVLNAVRPLISAIWSGLREAFSLEGLKSGGRAILDEFIPAPLKRWLESGAPDQGKNEGSRWSDPPMRKPVEQLRDSVEQNVDALHEGARVQRQSLKAMDDFRSLIHKASLNTTAQSISGSIGSGAAGVSAGVLSGLVGSGPGSAAWSPQVGAQINQGLRGHVARLRGNGGGSGGGSSNPAPEGASDPIPGTLNPRLAGSRKALMDELDRDPALRRDVLKTASMENRGSPMKMQTVLESMVNRAKMNGYGSLRQAIHSGFYGPVNRGGLRGALSEKDRRDGEAALAQVKGGSNVIGYRTDQGMLTDPGARRYMREADHSGHRVIAGENYFYMGQRGRQWAKQQEALDARQGSGDVAQRVAADTRRTQGLGSSLSKPNLGDLDLSPQNSLGSRAPLGESVPIRPTPSGSGGGGQGAGNAVHAPITVVSHGGDAEAIAGKVQRHLQDAMNRRTHDYDGFA